MWCVIILLVHCSVCQSGAIQGISYKIHVAYILCVSSDMNESYISFLYTVTAIWTECLSGLNISFPTTFQVYSIIISWFTLSPSVVWATGPGILPAIRNWTRNMGHSSFWPIQKPDLLTAGGPNLDQWVSIRRFHQDWVHPSVPIPGPTCRISHLLLHSDKLLVIVKCWQWYIMVCCWRIGHLNDEKTKRHAPYHILNMSFNGASMIADHESWGIWGTTGYTKS